MTHNHFKPTPRKHEDQATERAQNPLAMLTRREREVLGWLAECKRDAEIAVILGISVFTVSKHVQHVFEKLGVENRTAAARVLLDARIAPQPLPPGLPFPESINARPAKQKNNR